MKKLVHIIVCAVYRDGWGYQENILPQKHKSLGYDVEIITYNQFKDQIHEQNSCYKTSEGITVHTLPTREHVVFDKIPIIRAFYGTSHNRTEGLYEKLNELNPDIIFVHGIFMHDHYQVVDYVKNNPNVRLYVDNHSDYYNNPVSGLSGFLVIRPLGARIGKALSKYSRKIWAVTPWRLEYMQDIYKIPASKSGLLVMGGDETKIDYEHRSQIRQDIRKRFNIPEDCFLIVTGGKIDANKNIHFLVEAVNQIKNRHIKLLIFGKFDSEMVNNPVFQYPCVINAGWIAADKSYDYFLASDLAVFPGTHSVLWEQACASGIPGIFKDWDGGFNHVDVGGNAVLLKEISVKSIKSQIESLYFTPKYMNMLKVAQDKGPKIFSYMEIAKRAIEFQEFEEEDLN